LALLADGKTTAAVFNPTLPINPGILTLPLKASITSPPVLNNHPAPFKTGYT
jgi:hypothetical protein